MPVSTTNDYLQNPTLEEVQRRKAEMQERFFLHSEIQGLPSADREALFNLLYNATQGEADALRDIYDLVYEEIPVPMDEFILGRRYLNLRGLINIEKIDLMVEFDRPHVRRGYMAVGSGGGKSFVVGCMMARMIYQLLCLRRPDMFHMLSPGSKIASLNLSVNKDQARDVVFSEFMARVAHCRWFTGKYKAGKAKARFLKEVYAISGGSSPVAAYGYHTIFGSLDEACFLVDRRGENVAEQLVEALTKSMQSRFPGWYKLMVISTLRSPDDFLSTELERIREEGVLVLQK